jgi:hypothetical protein
MERQELVRELERLKHRLHTTLEVQCASRREIGRVLTPVVRVVPMQERNLLQANLRAESVRMPEALGAAALAPSHQAPRLPTVPLETRDRTGPAVTCSAPPAPAEGLPEVHSADALVSQLAAMADELLARFPEAAVPAAAAAH